MAAQKIVIKSPSDKREYKAIQLPNGVQVVLIHDPEMGTGEEHNPLERHLHPGEKEVVTDEDVESLMSEDASHSDASYDSEEEVR